MNLGKETTIQILDTMRLIKNIMNECGDNTCYTTERVGNVVVAVTDKEFCIYNIEESENIMLFKEVK